MIKKTLTILLTVALTTAASVWTMSRYFRFVPADQNLARRNQLSAPTVRSTDGAGYVATTKLPVAAASRANDIGYDMGHSGSDLQHDGRRVGRHDRECMLVISDLVHLRVV